MRPHCDRTRRQEMEKILTDPHYFIESLWEDRGLDLKAPLGEIEHDIIEHAFNGPRLRGSLALRGIGKTHFGSASLTVFRGLRDPNRQIIIVSKSVDAAKKTLLLIREWLDKVWFLQHLAPARDQRDAATYLDFGPAQENRQPSLVAIGIDGMLENNRAHTLIPDDVETKKNSKTLEARIELHRLCNEFTNIIYPDRPFEEGGPVDPTEIVYFGTPKHEDTLYLKLIKPPEGTKKTENFKFWSWPIIYPPADWDVINLAPLIAGRLERGEAKPWQPTIPARFGDDEIAMRLAQGMHEFQMESCMVANLSDAARYPLRLSDLIVFDVNRDQAPLSIAYGRRTNKGDTSLPIESVGLGDDRFYFAAMWKDEWAEYTGTVMFLDPAGGGTDETAYAIVSQLNGILYVKAVGGMLGGATEDNKNELARVARQHRATMLIVEDNAGWGLWADLLRPVFARHFKEPKQDPNFPDGWKCAIETKRSSGQKEVRICDTLEPVMLSRRLVFDRSVAADTTLQYQMTRIKRERRCLTHDDRVDALAGAVRYWQDQLQTDPTVAANDEVERRLRQQVIDHYADLGRLTSSLADPNWITPVSTMPRHQFRR